MNLEHYKSIKAVCELSEIVVARLTETHGSGGIMLSGLECQRVWDQFFPPTGEGRGNLDLSEADLVDCLFAGSWIFNPLKGASFQRADLERSRWFSVSIEGADFTHANLNDCVMLNVMCQGTSFRGSDLKGALLTLVAFPEIDSPVDFTDANLTNATIRLRTPLPAVLKGAEMAGCRVIATWDRPEDEDFYLKTLSRFLALLTPEQQSRITCQTGKEDSPETMEGENKIPLAVGTGTNPSQVDASAQFNLGMAYWTGKGAQQDKAEAVKCFSMAASLGYAPAQSILGALHLETGEKSRGIQMLQAAVDQGYPPAQLKLGLCYCSGDGIPRNVSVGEELIRKAAVQGFDRASDIERHRALVKRNRTILAIVIAVIVILWILAANSP